MFFQDGLHGFQFNNEMVCDQQVSQVLADNFAIVKDMHRGLLTDRYLRPFQFDTQRVLVNLLNKAAAKRFVYFECTSYDLLPYLFFGHGKHLYRRLFSWAKVLFILKNPVYFPYSSSISSTSARVIGGGACSPRICV